jgi:hypothetical protein
MIGEETASGMPVLAGESWLTLDDELKAWRRAGLTATFWWRDDDATRPGPRLDRLLGIAGSLPISLAVIPASVTESLAQGVAAHNARAGKVTVLQHGYAHANHAPASARKAEFGDHRPLGTMLGELDSGRLRLEKLFGSTFQPILTPPWNRICREAADNIHRCGLRRLSCFGSRRPEEAERVVNTHIDIIDWHGGRGFAGERQVLQAAVRHLAARRTGATDSDEATGVLTHHRDHDEACWRFIGRFVRAVAAHQAAAWVAP